VESFLLRNPLLAGLTRGVLKRSLLSLVLFGWVGCNSLFYYPSHKIYLSPERLKIQYQDHFFQAPDGLKLHGWLLLHEEGTPYRGLFVQFHGNAQNLSAHYLQLAWVLKQGYDLFVFDYAGYGQSEGEASRPSSIESGRAALQFVSDSLLTAEPPPPRLVLVGQSLGGAILMRCFADWKDRDKTTLVIIDGGFPSYQKIAQTVLSKSWLTWPIQPLAYVLVSERGSPEPFISRISPTPLLVSSCKEDPVVNPRFSREIFRQAKEPKWQWVFSPCGHIQEFLVPENQQRLLEFIDSLTITQEKVHAP
jgi:fermentation-respiration switch protein FrsA (DUF1100 family)